MPGQLLLSAVKHTVDLVLVDKFTLIKMWVVLCIHDIVYRANIKGGKTSVNSRDRKLHKYIHVVVIIN